MTAIVIPLGRATAAIPKNAEQAQAGMAADLYSVGAGSVAAGEAPAPDPAQTPPPQSSCAETPGSDPDLWLYRDRTTGLLRRYLRFSVEVGRLPSLLGREFFRTRVTSYHATTFEDAVIFVHDVERCLEKLDDLEKKLIAKIVFQDYTQDETARLLGCWRRTWWAAAFRKRWTG